MNTIAAKAEIPQYTYDSPEHCMAEARAKAYTSLVYKLRRGGEYRVEESIAYTREGTFITFSATPVNAPTKVRPGVEL